MFSTPMWAADLAVRDTQPVCYCKRFLWISTLLRAADPGGGADLTQVRLH